MTIYEHNISQNLDLWSLATAISSDFCHVDMSLTPSYALSTPRLTSQEVQKIALTRKYHSRLDRRESTV